MTTNMQLKFNKYWESGGINYLLLVVGFLDPRYKCDYIQFCFNHMYGVEKSMDMMKKLKGLIHKLIQQYVLKPFLVLVAIQPILVHLASNMASQHNDDKGDKSDDWDAEFKMKMKKKQGEVQKKNKNKTEIKECMCSYHIRIYNTQIAQLEPCSSLGANLLTWAFVQGFQSIPNLTCVFFKENNQVLDNIRQHVIRLRHHYTFMLELKFQQKTKC